MASGKSNDTSKSVKVSLNFSLFLLEILIKYNDGLFSKSFAVSCGGPLKKLLEVV